MDRLHPTERWLELTRIVGGVQSGVIRAEEKLSGQLWSGLLARASACAQPALNYTRLALVSAPMKMYRISNFLPANTLVEVISSLKCTAEHRFLSAMLLQLQLLLQQTHKGSGCAELNANRVGLTDWCVYFILILRSTPALQFNRPGCISDWRPTSSF